HGSYAGKTRELDREGGAASLAVALRKHAAAVRFGNRPHDVQAEAGPFDLLEAARLDAVEAVEDALELLVWDADPAILHAHPHRFGRRRRERHGHADALARVLHRIGDQVRDHDTEVVRLAQYHQS